MNQQNYKREIDSLKVLSVNDKLNPLRQEILKGQLMSHLSGTSTADIKTEKRFLWVSKRFTSAYAVLSVFVILLLTSGTVLASQGSLPGDALYPVKRLTEKVELQLAPTKKVKAEVQAKHATERVNELTELQVKVDAEVKTEQKSDTEKHHEEAKVEAVTELETALNTLNEVQNKLESKGNIQAATSLQTVMEKLTTKANEAQFDVEKEQDHGRIKVKFNESRRFDNSRDQEETPDDLRGRNQEKEKNKEGQNDQSNVPDVTNGSSATVNETENLEAPINEQQQETKKEDTTTEENKSDNPEGQYHRERSSRDSENKPSDRRML